MEKFLPTIKPGGALIYDNGSIITPPEREDIRIYSMDAMEAAAEMHNIKTFNMIVLGGLIKINPIVSIENIKKALAKTLPERHHNLIPVNEQAMLKGMEIIVQR